MTEARRPALAVKAATIASSLILVFGLISYRVGAFDFLASERAGSGVPAPVHPAPATQSATPSTYLSSSKSAGAVVVTPPASTPQSTAAPASNEPVFFSGSKSLGGIKVVPTQPGQPAPQAQQQATPSKPVGDFD